MTETRKRIKHAQRKAGSDTALPVHSKATAVTDTGNPRDWDKTTATATWGWKALEISKTELHPAFDFETEKHNIRYDLQRLAYYYGMRARFFDVLSKLSAIISLIAGTVAYQNIANSTGIVFSISSFLLAISAVTSVVIGYSQRAKDFEIRRSKIYGFIRQIETEDINIKTLRKISADLKNMSAEGPIFLNALDVIASRRACHSLGLSTDELPKLSRLQLILAHFWSFTGEFANHNRTYGHKKGRK